MLALQVDTEACLDTNKRTKRAPSEDDTHQDEEEGEDEDEDHQDAILQPSSDEANVNVNNVCRVLEICVDTVQSALAAARGGAGRIELCASLKEGGLTPSFGMIKQVMAKLVHAHLVHCRVNVMIRPRAGDFCYSEDEFQVMQEDIRCCKELGAHGVVFGVLKTCGNVDKQRLIQLVSLCQSLHLDMTFHRAFDMSVNMMNALETLIECGVPRVLTSGGECSAEMGAEALRCLKKEAAGKISIMAGAGITPDNIKQIAQEAGVDEYHGSMKCNHTSDMFYRPSSVSLSSEQILDYVWWVTDEAKVRQAVQELSKVVDINQ